VHSWLTFNAIKDLHGDNRIFADDCIRKICIQLSKDQDYSDLVVRCPLITHTGPADILSRPREYKIYPSDFCLRVRPQDARGCLPFNNFSTILFPLKGKIDTLFFPYIRGRVWNHGIQKYQIPRGSFPSFSINMHFHVSPHQ